MSKKFHDLVQQACATEYEFRSHSGDPHMSADSLIDACLRHADSSHHRLQTLRETLQARGSAMRSTTAFIHQGAKLVADGRAVSGIPRGVERMALPSGDECRSELSEIGYSLWEAWALGMQQAHERHPQAFGSVRSCFKTAMLDTTALLAMFLKPVLPSFLVKRG